MDRVSLNFFPFPYIYKEERFPGLWYDWPDRCGSCDRQCERSRSNQLGLCSYGVNFMMIEPDLLVAGIIVKDFPETSPARVKMLRRVPKGPTMAEVNWVVQTYQEIQKEELDEIRSRKDEIINDYKASASYKTELLELLRPEFKKMLAQIHDYRQFVTQVVQNVNVILEKRAPGEDIDEKLRAAEHEEVAIYWAARLMEEKIETALFLLDPEKIDDPSNEKVFRFHGCVLKYVRIYQKSFDQKEVRITVSGESFGMVRANPKAVSVIPHTFIDNALKYSPRGSEVEIIFEERDDSINFSVGSLGPKIDAEERDAIFDLFYRSKEARRLEPEGTGFGLHLSQIVARNLGSKIVVHQESLPNTGKMYWTEFSISLPHVRSV